MITLYQFAPDGALLNKVERPRALDIYQANYSTLPRAGLTMVLENHDALRAMMHHFGDDSSWPAGWWERLQGSGGPTL